MLSQEIDDLLSLLATVVVADKRVYAAEVEAFLVAATEIKIPHEGERHITEAKALAWYEMNKASVKKEFEGPNFKDWLYERLDRLARIADKQAILNAMSDISHSDGELHISEQALMVLTARQWELEAIPYKGGLFGK